MFEGQTLVFRLGATKWCQVVVEGDGCTILGEGLDLGGGGVGRLPKCHFRLAPCTATYRHDIHLAEHLEPHFLARFDAHGLGTEVGRVSGLAQGNLGTLFLSAGGRLLML